MDNEPCLRFDRQDVQDVMSGLLLFVEGALLRLVDWWTRSGITSMYVCLYRARIGNGSRRGRQLPRHRPRGLLISDRGMAPLIGQLANLMTFYEYCL